MVDLNQEEMFRRYPYEVTVEVHWPPQGHTCTPARWLLDQKYPYHFAGYGEPRYTQSGSYTQRFRLKHEFHAFMFKMSWC